MQLPKEEQETVLCFTEADEMATISTYHFSLKDTLYQFSRYLPHACQLQGCTEEGKQIYHIDRQYLALCFAPQVLAELEYLLTFCEETEL